MTKKQFRKFCHSLLGVSMMMLPVAAVLLGTMTASTVNAAVQQDGKESQITGLVTDQQKDPLPGVTVTEVGTQNVVITDADGVFHTKVTSRNGVQLHRF